MTPNPLEGLTQPPSPPSPEICGETGRYPCLGSHKCRLPLAHTQQCHSGWACSATGKDRQVGQAAEGPLALLSSLAL